MKRGVLRYLEQQREQQVTGWLVHLQAACMGHLARQNYRKLKVSVQVHTRCAPVEVQILVCTSRSTIQLPYSGKSVKGNVFKYESKK